jgi:hypothetical protein
MVLKTTIESNEIALKQLQDDVVTLTPGLGSVYNLKQETQDQLKMISASFAFILRQAESETLNTKVVEDEGQLS